MVLAAAAAAAKSLQSCPTLCDPIDSSPPGPPVPGILQARTLEWVAIGSKARAETDKKQLSGAGSGAMDVERSRFPYCVVWTPIPVLT